MTEVLKYITEELELITEALEYTEEMEGLDAGVNYGGAGCICVV